jgi:glycosyltransferase involved in cell wall biosynthesis
MVEKLLFYTKMNFAVKGNSGIKKKVFAQAKAFRSHGFEVDVLFFEDNKIYVEGDNARVSFEAENKLQFLLFLYGGFLKKVDFSSYNYVYVRHFLTNPLFLRMLKKMKALQPKAKTFMEIPTYPYRHTFKNESIVKRAGLVIDEISSRFFKKYIDRIVTFARTPEIFGIPTTQTDNGIDTDVFGFIPPPLYNESELHLGGVANIQTWHGYDRLINGFADYYANKFTTKVYFHIVGGGGNEVNKLKDLADKLGLSQYAFFYGFLDGDELVNVLKKLHIGVSNLAFHRIGAAKGETSALKSREYASRGIPFVSAYRDRGFPSDYPQILEIKADNSAVDIDELIGFYNKLQATPQFAENLRSYAVEHLSWKNKLKPVSEAFRNN